MTLYAQWTPITYTVRFDGNGATSGTMDDLAVTYDAEATLPARRYAKANKTFTGWNTKKDGSGASYGDKAAIRNLASVQDEVIVLYAQWADAMTVLPDTGGQAAGHAPFAAGMAVTASGQAWDRIRHPRGMERVGVCVRSIKVRPMWRNCSVRKSSRN